MAVISTESLDKIFVSAAKAAAGAQARLDEALVAAPAFAHTIPRVTIDAKFVFTQVAGKTVLIFGEKREQQLAQTIHFELLLAPEPQVAASEAGTVPPTVVLLPPFIIPPEEAAQVIRAIRTELSSHGAAYEDELQELSKTVDSDDLDRGIVVLPLSRPSRYLVVRTGGKRDGIFVHDGSAEPRLKVYLHRGSKSDVVLWQPFHELFDCFRRWQISGASGITHANVSLPGNFGTIDTAEFIAGFWTAFRNARQLLAAKARPAAPALPAYYELHETQARLGYSVPRETGSPDRESPFIRSDVAIRIPEGSGASRIDVSLTAPEYILVDEAQQAIVDLLVRNARSDPNDGDSIFSVIRREYAEAYMQAILNVAAQRSALAFLCYRGDAPENRFIVLWPGELDGEKRQFAVAFGYDEGKLVDFELVLPLEDPIGASLLGLQSNRPFAAAQVEYSKKGPLHCMFRAMWRWILAGGWFPR